MAVSKFSSSRDFIIKSAVPLTYGVGDATGLVGLSIVDSSGASLTLTEVNFSLDPAIMEMYIKTSSKILKGEIYTLAYDATLGSLTELASYTETEKMTSADMVGPTTIPRTGTSYVYQYLPLGSVGTRNYKIEAASGSGAINPFQFTFGRLSRDSAMGVVNPGEIATFYYKDRNTTQLYAEVINNDVTNIVDNTVLDYFSVKELVPVLGSPIASVVNLILTNYLDTRIAHISHFKFDEISGVRFTDSISGMYYEDNTVGNLTFVPNGVLIGNVGNVEAYKNNTLGGYGAGIGIFYFSCDWYVDGGATNKAGLSHIAQPVNIPVDIQHSGGGTTTEIRIVGDDPYGAIGASTQLQEGLTGVQDLIAFNGGSFAGAVVIDFKSIGNNKIYIGDGAAGGFDAALAVGNSVSRYDLSDSALGWNITNYNLSASEGKAFTPAHRLSTTYQKGIYMFKNFEPTPAEIRTFVDDLYNRSRTSDKTVYPAWVDKD